MPDAQLARMVLTMRIRIVTTALNLRVVRHVAVLGRDWVALGIFGSEDPEGTTWEADRIVPEIMDVGSLQS
jgi:hypothetical protein